jgi:hypothetical protein
MQANTGTSDAETSNTHCSTRTWFRTLPSCDISLGSLTLPALEAGDFMEYIQLHTYSTSVAARSKAWVCGRRPAGITGLKLLRGRGCLSLVMVVLCQVEFSAAG